MADRPVDPREPEAGPKYPMVRCDRHGPPKDKPGYAACIHIFSGITRSIGHFFPASHIRMGECLCFFCHVTPPPVDNLRLICGDCLRELVGTLPVDRRKK